MCQVILDLLDILMLLSKLGSERGMFFNLEMKTVSTGSWPLQNRIAYVLAP